MGFIEIQQGNFVKAEQHFINTQRSVEATGREEFNYGVHVGLGIIRFHQRQLDKAQSHFFDAIRAHPNCPSSVRIAAAAVCFYKAEYARCRAILDRVLVLDPGHAETLVMLALLEQVAAKDKTKRANAHRAAYEYCVIAKELDKTCCPALNLMANHMFHTWKHVADSAIARPVSAANAALSSGVGVPVEIVLSGTEATSCQLVKDDLVNHSTTHISLPPFSFPFFSRPACAHTLYTCICNTLLFYISAFASASALACATIIDLPDVYTFLIEK
jgi:hypothetical protein